ncbi:MAG: hypothetical protein IPH72_27020 [Sandaracinaceae bacterium]|nr:hypothetical protein [Sandaracinaceae bacterium]
MAAMRGVPVTSCSPPAVPSPSWPRVAAQLLPRAVGGRRVYLPASSEPVLHSKTLLVDDIAIVGTANMDNRSFRLNFEVVAVATSSVSA